MPQPDDLLSPPSSRPPPAAQPTSCHALCHHRHISSLDHQHHSAAGSPTKLASPTPADASPSDFRWILAGSAILTFNAGFINALTIQSAPSSYVTGVVAMASTHAAVGSWRLAADYAVAYLCFLLGACVSGVIITCEVFYMGRNYGRALFLMAGIQAMALMAEKAFPGTVSFVWACAVSCGLQNGLTSKYSGNTLRTTHLTGATTDLGIAIGHILKKRPGEWWKVRLHTTAITGFVLGTMVGWHAYERFKRDALLVNMSLTVFCAVVHTGHLAYREGVSTLIGQHDRSLSSSSGYGACPTSGKHMAIV